MSRLDYTLHISDGRVDHLDGLIKILEGLPGKLNQIAELGTMRTAHQAKFRIEQTYTQSQYDVPASSKSSWAAHPDAKAYCNRDRERKGYSFKVGVTGKDVLFMEFGAGIHFNGAAGGSPHPEGAEKGMIIGGYGNGMGKRNVWLRPGGYVTFGTPANMGVYNTKKYVEENFADNLRDEMRRTL